MSQVFKIWKNGLKIIFGVEISHFCCLVMRERERKKSKLLSSIHGVPSIGIHRAKNESHLLYKGYSWVLKTRDFAEDSSKEFGKSKVSGLGSVHGTSEGFYYAPRSRDSSYFYLFSTVRAVWWCFLP